MSSNPRRLFQFVFSDALIASKLSPEAFVAALNATLDIPGKSFPHEDEQKTVTPEIWASWRANTYTLSHAQQNTILQGCFKALEASDRSSYWVRLLSIHRPKARSSPQEFSEYVQNTLDVCKVNEADFVKALQPSSPHPAPPLETITIARLLEFQQGLAFPSLQQLGAIQSVLGNAHTLGQSYQYTKPEQLRLSYEEGRTSLQKDICAFLVEHGKPETLIDCITIKKGPDQGKLDTRFTFTGNSDFGMNAFRAAIRDVIGSEWSSKTPSQQQAAQAFQTIVIRMAELSSTRIEINKASKARSE